MGDESLYASVRRVLRRAGAAGHRDGRAGAAPGRRRHPPRPGYRGPDGGRRAAGSGTGVDPLGYRDVSRYAQRDTSEAAMHTWTLDAPQRITVDEPVTRLDVNLVAGRRQRRRHRRPARSSTSPGSAARRSRSTSATAGCVVGHARGRRAGPGSCGGSASSAAATAPTSRSPCRPAPPSTSSWSPARWSPPGLRGEHPGGADRRQGHADGPRRPHVGQARLRPGRGARRRRRPHPGDGLRRADPRRQPAQRVHARTVSGAITCDLSNPRHSEVRLATTSGSITVRVREDSDLAVAAAHPVRADHQRVPRRADGRPARRPPRQPGRDRRRHRQALGRLHLGQHRPAGPPAPRSTA